MGYPGLIFVRKMRDKVYRAARAGFPPGPPRAAWADRRDSMLGREGLGPPQSPHEAPHSTGRHVQPIDSIALAGCNHRTRETLGTAGAGKGRLERHREAGALAAFSFGRAYLRASVFLPPGHLGRSGLRPPLKHTAAWGRACYPRTHHASLSRFPGTSWAASRVTQDRLSHRAAYTSIREERGCLSPHTMHSDRAQVMGPSLCLCACPGLLCSCLCWLLVWIGQ